MAEHCTDYAVVIVTITATALASVIAVVIVTVTALASVIVIVTITATALQALDAMLRRAAYGRRKIERERQEEGGSFLGRERREGRRDREREREIEREREREREG